MAEEKNKNQNQQSQVEQNRALFVDLLGEAKQKIEKLREPGALVDLLPGGVAMTGVTKAIGASGMPITSSLLQKYRAIYDDLLARSEKQLQQLPPSVAKHAVEALDFEEWAGITPLPKQMSPEEIKASHEATLSLGEKAQQVIDDSDKLLTKIDETRKAKQRGFRTEPLKVSVGAERAKAAREAGFDPGIYFYGGTREFDEFDPSKIGTGLDVVNTGAFYFTPEIRAADKVARSKKFNRGPSATARTMAVRLRLGKIKNVDWMEETGRETFDVAEMSALVERAKKQGFNSIVVRNMTDPDLAVAGNMKIPQILVFKPNQIRRVDAKFDPKMLHSGKLLASVGGGVAALTTFQALKARDKTSKLKVEMGSSRPKEEK